MSPTEILALAVAAAKKYARLQMRVDDGLVQWRTDGEWVDLIALESLRGPKGEPGESIKGDKGDKGEPGESIKGDPGKDGKDGVDAPRVVSISLLGDSVTVKMSDGSVVGGDADIMERVSELLTDSEMAANGRYAEEKRILEGIIGSRLA